MTITAIVLAALLIASWVGHLIKADALIDAQVALAAERSKCESLETALAAALADRPLAPVLPNRGGA